MRLWTSTCSRPTCSANSLSIGKVVTTLTEAAWPVGGGTSGRGSAIDSVMGRVCNMGGTVTPSLFNVNEDNPTGLPVESSIFTEGGSLLEKASLRQPGAILLVSCYELGHQPIGIALPMGFLEQAGYAPASLDIAVEKVDLERIRQARFVGISVPMHTALRLGVRVAELVRETNPSCHICFYGLYASLNAEYLLELFTPARPRRDDPLQPGATGTPTRPFPFADSVIGGEYEAPLVRVMEALERGDSLTNVEGVSHRGKIVGPLLNGPGHSLSIVRAMRAEFPRVTFDFTAKVEHILKHRSIFSELGSLGCLFVISAVESFSDLVLTKLEKGHTRADVFAALEIVRQAGITLRASLVPFTPWATLDDYLELFDIVESHDLVEATDPVQYTIRLLIPPGSALLTRSDVRRFLGPLDQAGFQYQWTHPDPRMDKLHREVSAAVEAAASTSEDPAATFDRLRAIAYRFADRQPAAPTASRTPSRNRHRPPRLTEPWFCCAEPTERQLHPLHTKGCGEV